VDVLIRQQLQKAFSQLQSSNTRLAKETLSTLLHNDPNQIDALLMLVRILSSESKFDQARTTLKTILAQAHISIEQLRAVAQQLSHLELYFLLAQALQRLSAMQENKPKIHLQLGLCWSKVGKIEEAVDYFKACLEHSDTHNLALINLGHAYKALGESDLAANYYHRFINTAKPMIGTGFWSLADLKDYTFNEQDIATIEQSIKHPVHALSNPKELSFLHFAYARAHEQQKDILASVKALNTANRIIGQERPFKQQALQHLASAQMTHFSSFECSVNDSQTCPIFIVGMPRSGTTLCEQILGSHSDVATSDELPFIERIAIQISVGNNYCDAVSSLSEKECKHFASYYLEQAQEYVVDAKKFLIDKNPTNFLHIPLIKKLFPNAKIVALLRDPLDNTMSVYKQHFSHGNDFSFTIDNILFYTSVYYSLLQHWQANNPGLIYQLHYAELVTDTEKTIRSLLTYCDLDYQQACLHFYKSKRRILTPSASQVRKPITTSALGSGDKYLPYLTDQHIKKVKALKQQLALSNIAEKAP
jgi:tetratricopeptide (TPR) repeat protein